MRTASEDRDWPGTALRVPGEGDFEEALRRALRSAADGVEPTGDALTQIFRRVAAPWLARQVSLLAADCVDLLRLTTIWLQPMFAWAMAVLAAVGGWVHEALRRLTSQAPAAAPISSGQHRRGRARGAVFRGRSPALKPRAWACAAVARLRPALPVAVTAAVVMTGTVVLGQTVARIELSGNRGAGTSALAGATPATGDHRQSPQSDLTRPSPAQIIPARPGTTPASGGGATHQRSCAAMRCLPTRSHHHPHQPHPHPSHHSHPPHPGRAGTPGH